MESGYEDEEQEFESAELFSPKLLFSFPVIINGNKTEVTFNLCGKGVADAYYAVNLVRNGMCVNSFTMSAYTDPATKSAAWKFEEDYVPRELKSREAEFSNAIIGKRKV